jgi:hypothetical protein
MARKTKFCIASNVVESDAFIDMSDKAKLLYFCLNMESDWFGCVEHMRKLLRGNDFEQPALDELVKSGFVIPAKNKQGEDVYYISDWWVNNNLDKSKRIDRHNEQLTTELFGCIEQYTASQNDNVGKRYVVGGLPVDNQLSHKEKVTTKVNINEANESAIGKGKGKGEFEGDTIRENLPSIRIDECPRCQHSDLTEHENNTYFCRQCGLAFVVSVDRNGVLHFYDWALGNELF